METLIAFSCYYRADDVRIAGRMEQFYTEALGRYKDFKYSEWHPYIVRKMTDWYKVFLFETTSNDVVDVDFEAGEVEEGAVVEAPPVVDGGASGMFSMSPPPGEDEGGEGDKGPGEAADDNATAATEGEAPLAANGAAATT